ncbi:hypothetical protein CY34DRAFT_282951 [Suillus luteus UH-Slu-Lm8-n1]|uniref:Uncharacterized protein n=1 Tax=Suillus luteus UH-Slu-Lm8-n1 TaxID=930992 RepID=A0A0C9ZR19_9AGAM|nr:hypothetical protein CY34DRAFT_282951 [Suillus luteus UH-Slu-Lm8-n1]
MLIIKRRTLNLFNQIPGQSASNIPVYYACEIFPKRYVVPSVRQRAPGQPAMRPLLTLQTKVES